MVIHIGVRIPVTSWKLQMRRKKRAYLVHQRMTVSNHCDVAQRTVGYSGWDVARKDSVRIQSANQNET